MKQIREFTDQTEALLAKDFLEINGIRSELHGGKEYSTHIVGGTYGHYFLSVPEADAGRAETLLHGTQKRSNDQIQHPTETTEVALKKSIMYAVIAVVLLPVLGNWISLREAMKYARLEKRDIKWAWLFLISWLQVPGLYLAYILVRAALSWDLVEIPL